MPAKIDGVSFFPLPKLGTQGLFVSANFLGNITKREKSAIEGKETAGKNFFEDMRNKVWADLFLKRIIKKTSEFYCLDNPFLIRKRTYRRNYKFCLNSFLQAQFEGFSNFC